MNDFVLKRFPRKCFWKEILGSYNSFPLVLLELTCIEICNYDLIHQSNTFKKYLFTVLCGTQPYFTWLPQFTLWSTVFSSHLWSTYMRPHLALFSSEPREKAGFIIAPISQPWDVRCNGADRPWLGPLGSLIATFPPYIRWSAYLIDSVTVIFIWVRQEWGRASPYIVDILFLFL